jgi:hypothetical protein
MVPYINHKKVRDCSDIKQITSKNYILCSLVADLVTEYSLFCTAKAKKVSKELNLPANNQLTFTRLIKSDDDDDDDDDDDNDGASDDDDFNPSDEEDEDEEGEEDESGEETE